MSARVLSAQPRGGRLIVYGALSLEAVHADPSSLIFEGKHVEGFWLSAWLRNRGLIGQLRIARQVQALLGQELKTDIQARFPLEQVQRALEQYISNMTAGKILITP
jgi:NADPH:quinone reductase-like Zn-dependent oxidoreductase